MLLLTVTIKVYDGTADKQIWAPFSGNAAAMYEEQMLTLRLGLLLQVTQGLLL